MVTDVRLQLSYDTGTFTFTNVDFNGSPQGFFNLATAFNSLQNEEVQEIRKIVRTMLF